MALASITPRAYQDEIIKKSVQHFQTNDKGILNLICGVGKTLISLWITQELKCNTFLVGVPNILLLNQWKKVIRELFVEIPCLFVSSGITEQEIISFLTKHSKNCVILTTYASCHKVYSATESISFEFKMKINDEVHHLNSTCDSMEGKKEYIQMLYIASKKQLSLTATLKEIEKEGAISNTSIEHFGKIIDTKCLLWAIQNNILCDYVVQTIILKQHHADDLFTHFHVVEENKRLFLSAYISLKSIIDGNVHHLLIYSNSQLHSSQIITYIKLLLEDGYFDIPGLEYSDYHSSLGKKEQEKILSRFEKADYGIISCVYCLGEGWDFPKLSGEVFSENMTSTIRSVQSALRGSRKNRDEPGKISKIILPILNPDDWTDSNPDFKKVTEVIYQMGQEDATILQKVKAYHIDGKHPRQKSKEEEDINFGEYDEEFTKHLRLKTINRTAFGITYAKAKNIIADYHIKTRAEYNELCERDIRLSLYPETTFPGQFTNWVDYLSIERVYYNLEMCKKKASDYMRENYELSQQSLNLIEISRRLCVLDALFPPYDLWVDYYKTELVDIIVFSNKKKGVVRI
jgi:superfamily II DNA or RNA helicase